MDRARCLTTSILTALGVNLLIYLKTTNTPSFIYWIIAISIFVGIVPTLEYIRSEKQNMNFINKVSEIKFNDAKYEKAFLEMKEKFLKDSKKSSESDQSRVNE